MGIANFFGLGSSQPVTSTVDQQSTADAVSTAATSTGTDDPQTVQPVQSPLDTYKDIWNTALKSDDKAKPEDIFAVDQGKLGEAAGKLDFSTVIKQDQLAAIARGGDEAVTAFASAMNDVARATWQSNFATSAQFMKEAFARKEAELDARISSALRNHGIDSTIASNPVFNHPAAKPVVGLIARAMAATYPDATPQELQVKSAELLAEIASGAKPHIKATTAVQSAPQVHIPTDFDAWLKT